MNSLQKEARCWRRLLWITRVLRVTGLVVAVTFVYGGYAAWRAETVVLGGLVGSVAMLLGIWWGTRGTRVTARHIAEHLDRTRPAMEESCTLLLREEHSLNALERVQRMRIQLLLEREPACQLFPRRKLYEAVSVWGIALVVGLAGFLGGPSLWQQVEERAVEVVPVSASHPSSQEQPAANPRLLGSEVVIHPPSYTRLRPERVDLNNIEAIEGASIDWILRVNRSDLAAHVVFSEGDTLRASTEERAVFTVSHRVHASRLYRIVLSSPEGHTYESPYYAIKAVPDTSPVIAITTPEQRTVIDLNQPRRVEVEASVRDDFGVGALYMVATVSSGFGEGIKFREDTLYFDKIARQNPRVYAAKAVLDLNKLDMSLGDELYFYVKAFDTRQPFPNAARSETYFIVLPDTAREQLAFSEGLPVDNLPAYFRSQRQIIIDTEQLIREKGTIDVGTYKNRSNNLGLDQKLLRLRYGEFLGEELETNSGATGGTSIPDSDEDGHDHEDDHDHAHDQNHTHEHSHEEGGHGHDHGAPSSADPNSKEDPIAAFAHFHDYEENATLFSQSVQTLLRAALSEMWDAELHLRMHRPEEALPYEYRALDLLKDVQQRSRIYVKRIGFEPPPLKPDEMRLTGELDRIASKKTVSQVSMEAEDLSLRAAIDILEKLIAAESTPEVKNAIPFLEEAGRLIAQIALEYPGRYLDTLQRMRAIIRALEAGIIPSQDDLYEVQRTCWSLLPPPVPTPVQRRTVPTLMDRYLDRLGALP